MSGVSPKSLCGPATQMSALESYILKFNFSLWQECVIWIRVHKKQWKSCHSGSVVREQWDDGNHQPTVSWLVVTATESTKTGLNANLCYLVAHLRLFVLWYQFLETLSPPSLLANLHQPQKNIFTSIRLVFRNITNVQIYESKQKDRNNVWTR